MNFRYTFINADPQTKSAVMSTVVAGKTGLLMKLFNANQPRKTEYSLMDLDGIFQEAVRHVRAHPLKSLTARSNITEIQKAYTAMWLPDFLMNTKNIPESAPEVSRR
jgi:Ni2+-binding GTPase involved in maturation of urease and hydrogenase